MKSRKIDAVDDYKLRKEVAELGFKIVAEKYEVQVSSVRKRLKRYLKISSKKLVLDEKRINKVWFVENKILEQLEDINVIANEILNGKESSNMKLKAAKEIREQIKLQVTLAEQLTKIIDIRRFQEIVLDEIEKESPMCKGRIGKRLRKLSNR